MQAGLSNNELSVNPASKPATDERWEAFLTANPRGQFQQSWRWAEVKAAVGWQGVLGDLAGGFLILINRRVWVGSDLSTKVRCCAPRWVRNLARLSRPFNESRGHQFRMVFFRLWDGSLIEP